MCGIVGFIDKKNILTPEEQEAFIKKMGAVIEHRGRDSNGSYHDASVSLGHRRLSIIDLDPRASQPFVSSNNDVIASFNGEIYNYQNINTQLKNEYKFRTTTDTETIVNAYHKWGMQCFSKMKGMWALAILDKKNNRVVLSVDRFGIKPIYIINTDRWFAFASEAKALFVLPGITPEINREAIPEYLLFRSLSGNQTLFKNITKLLPGTSLIFDLAKNKFEEETYWRLEKKEISTDPLAKLEQLLDISINEHLIADAPIGLQLSGGVDSSLIAAFAVQKNHSQFHSFSIGLPDAKENEFEYSSLVAKTLHTRHHQLIFSEKIFASILPRLTYHMDEPINHAHSVPMFLLAQEASQYVKILLSGEGADEIFGGYRRYEKLLSYPSHQSIETLARMNSFTDTHIMSPLTHASFAKAFDWRLHFLQDLPNTLSNLDKICLLDLATYLTPLLIRQDKMGMAATLENRVPFLDHELVEFAFSLPDQLKLRDEKNPFLRTKWILKQVALRSLPESIVLRRKVGFGLPMGRWLQNSTTMGAYFKLLLDPCNKELINSKNIQKIILEHIDGVRDHTEALWILINLEIWSRIFLKNEDPTKLWDAIKPKK